jgi:hypothetical protein
MKLFESSAICPTGRLLHPSYQVEKDLQPQTSGVAELKLQQNDPTFPPHATPIFKLIQKEDKSVVQKTLITNIG